MKKSFLGLAVVLVAGLGATGYLVSQINGTIPQSMGLAAAAAALPTNLPAEAMSGTGNLIVVVPGAFNEIDSGPQGRMTDLINYVSQNIPNFGDNFNTMYFTYPTGNQPVQANANALNATLKSVAGKYGHVYIITHSGGSMVVRSAVINAEGSSCPGVSDPAATPADPALQNLYNHATIINISPILGGGAAPIGSISASLLLSFFPLSPDNAPHSAYAQCLFSTANANLFNSSVFSDYDFTLSGYPGYAPAPGHGNPWSTGDWALSGVWNTMASQTGYACPSTATPVLAQSPTNQIWYQDYLNAKAPGTNHISYYYNCRLPGESTTAFDPSQVQVLLGPPTLIGFTATDPHFALLEYLPVWTRITTILNRPWEAKGWAPLDQTMLGVSLLNDASYQFPAPIDVNVPLCSAIQGEACTPTCGTGNCANGTSPVFPGSALRQYYATSCDAGGGTPRVEACINGTYTRVPIIPLNSTGQNQSLLPAPTPLINVAISPSSTVNPNSSVTLTASAPSGPLSADTWAANGGSGYSLSAKFILTVNGEGTTSLGTVTGTSLPLTLNANLANFPALDPGEDTQNWNLNVVLSVVHPYNNTYPDSNYSYQYYGVPTQITIVNAAPTVTLIATPGQIAAGNASKLTWTSTNATSCSSNDFATAGATSNQTGVSTGNLSATKTYTITCTGAGGSTSAWAAVNVNAWSGQIGMVYGYTWSNTGYYPGTGDGMVAATEAFCPGSLVGAQNKYAFFNDYLTIGSQFGTTFGTTQSIFNNWSLPAVPPPGALDSTSNNKGYYCSPSTGLASELDIYNTAFPYGIKLEPSGIVLVGVKTSTGYGLQVYPNGQILQAEGSGAPALTEGNSTYLPYDSTSNTYSYYNLNSILHTTGDYRFDTSAINGPYIQSLSIVNIPNINPPATTPTPQPIAGYPQTCQEIVSVPFIYVEGWVSCSISSPGASPSCQAPAFASFTPLGYSMCPTNTGTPSGVSE